MAVIWLLIVRYKVLFGRLTKLTSAALLGLGVMASAASAATIFDFTGSRTNLGLTQSYTVDGITVDVTTVGGDIHRNRNGLGVTTNPDRNRIGSNGSVNESLTFTFSQKVNLLSSVVFEHRDSFEMFEILDGDSNVLAIQRIMGAGGSSAVTLPGLNFEGDTFTFRHLSGSGIRIDQLTVLAAVPLPASMPLALLAVGGLVVLGRRRKTA
ncbi:MAG: VPLPA-CTERM sorting domain-containing protein [Pseudomonadota bacterium]